MRRSLLIFALFIALFAVSGSAAIDIEYVGSVTQNLHSPTLITVVNDELAVMDPFAQELSLYSADRTLAMKVLVEGQASGLCRLDEATYLFCNHTGRSIEAVDVTTGNQFSFLTAVDGFLEPTDLLVNGDTISVLDAGNSSILRYSTSGTYLDRITVVNDSGVPLEFASAFAFDHGTGDYYVVDQTSATITAVTQGADSRTFSSYGSGESQLTRPGGIAAAPGGAVLVTDRYQGRVQVFSVDGRHIGGFSAQEYGEEAFSTPIGICLDEDGTIFVASAMSPSIQIFRGDFQNAVRKPVATVPQWPPDGSSVAADKLELIINAEADSGIGMTGFEYRLFTDDPMAHEIDRSAIITPDSIEVHPHGRVTLAASWTPSAQLSAGLVYHWQARAITTDTTEDWSTVWAFTVQALPGTFRLDQNFPNPFNPNTEIRFSIPQEGDAKLIVYNLLGQEVVVLVDEYLDAGEHTVHWNGANDSGRAAASGVYVYRLETDGQVATRKMVLVK